MSRSRKKAIYQDKPRSNPRYYNKIYRRCWSQITHDAVNMTDDGLDRIEYPDRNAILEFWDISDYKIDAEHDSWFCKLLNSNSKIDLKTRLSRK